ncbi:MAG: hypothetical protein HYX67_09565 [Candidatus Melainabacteria bacterium]|nr:hypothetical protein [Candidatus Melainabacteria bacterium]
MNKSAALLLTIVLCQTSAALASSESQIRAQQFSGASDEYQADIPMHRANWKASMDKAVDYVKNGDFIAAQKMVDVARKEANASGANDPSLAETEKMAGDISVAQKNLSAAERSYRRSVYLFERANSPDKSQFSAALSSYASLLKSENRIREASRFETRANLLRGNDNSTAETNRSL